jgi:F-box protein 18 (helicase)
VLAFAGTGKTTTLLHFARSRPGMRFLYVAFNRSVQQQAERVFPENVTCRTVHSLAWNACGRPFQSQLAPRLHVSQVMRTLRVKDPITARLAIETLQNFLVSGEGRVHGGHLPGAAHAIYRGKTLPDFVQMARELWIRMSDTQSEEIPMLHDGYLKLFQLSEPRLPFDCILLDEAQDTNPVTAALLLRQPATCVMVGDPHQAIYQFRGAVDLMTQISTSRTFHLTGSFRFGSAVAQVASDLLWQFKGERFRIKGLRESDRLGAVTGVHTVVARTNAGLFDQAVELPVSQPLGFVGGISGYQFDLLHGTWHLWKGNSRELRDPLLKSFPSFEELRSYAEHVEDHEWLSRCRIVEKYRAELPGLLEDLKARSEASEEAQVQLTTAHKAKGLEFAQVRLADDFTPLIKGRKPLGHDDLADEEVNLCYVAVTRASERLEPNARLSAFLRWRKQRLSGMD